MKQLLRMMLFAVLLVPMCAWAEVVPRQLLAIYDGEVTATPRDTFVHQFLEMPANALGFDVRYHDVRKAYPELGEDVAGVVVWFPAGYAVPDAAGYLKWLDKETAAGKKLVVLEHVGVDDKVRSDPDQLKLLQAIFRRIGVVDTNRWQSLTYSSTITAFNKELVAFEIPYPSSLPSYLDTRVSGEKTVSHLTVTATEGKEVLPSDLVITSPGGGYSAAGYTLYHQQEDEVGERWRWYIHPIRFLRAALVSELAPMPDVASVQGSQAFYVQVDGDGWNEASYYKDEFGPPKLAGEILTQKIFSAYPAVPFQLGLITSQLDPECYGREQSRPSASRALALANVEAATHTDSHPLLWRFFTGYSKDKEEPYLERYPVRPIQERSFYYGMFGNWIWKKRWWSAPEPESPPALPVGKFAASEKELLNSFFALPRLSACHPFDLAREIAGSAKEIEALMPEGKKVRMVSWSGDMRPFREALAAARGAGLANLGGGNGRLFVQSAPYSLTSISPIGLWLNGERQIYSSNEGEVGLVRNADGGFPTAEQVVTPFAFVSRPHMLKPISLYLHSTVGTSEVALDATRSVLNHYMAGEYFPLFAADYAKMAQGFGTARVEKLGPMKWKVSNHGSLPTLRFDRATLLTVDYGRSSGVVGHRWRAGSLFVYLDTKVNAPEVALTALDSLGAYPSANRPYLITSRWLINSLHISNNLLIFTGQGLGPGEMRWKMPENGTYHVSVRSPDGKQVELSIPTDGHGELKLSLEAVASLQPVTVTLSRQNEESAADCIPACDRRPGGEHLARSENGRAGADQL